MSLPNVQILAEAIPWRTLWHEGSRINPVVISSDSESEPEPMVETWLTCIVVSDSEDDADMPPLEQVQLPLRLNGPTAGPPRRPRRRYPPASRRSTRAKKCRDYFAPLVSH